MKHVHSIWFVLAVLPLQQALASSPAASLISGFKDSCEGYFEQDSATLSSHRTPPPNPITDPSPLDHGAIPYDRIQTSDFRPALLRSLAQAKARLLALRNKQETPTYENTIEALEALDEPFSQADATFSHYLSAQTSPELEALAEEVNPKFSQFANSVYFDAKLFARVEALYQQRANLNLGPEQAQLLEKYYRAFLRNGAKLTPEQKARVTEIDQRISVLGETYRKNINTSVRNFELVVTDASELEGLPSSAVQAAAEEAAKRNRPGAWVFTLQAPSYGPVMQFAESRALREKLWRGYYQRGLTPEADNRPVMLEIAKLRQERARIFGYATHADFVTADRMAGNRKTVEEFLKHLASAYRPAAQKELEELRAVAGHELKPWDISFYSAIVQSRKFDFHAEELRPYFPLDQVLKGAFYAAERLHGVTFQARPDLPGWQPSVKAFEVRDSQGDYLGLLYIDPFPRDSKSSGAWKANLSEGGWFSGGAKRPQVVNVGNFSPPVGDGPALLTPGEVTTAFHELGHGLHELLSRTRYRSFFGTKVKRDFVEFPSQLNEKWAFAPEVLAVYARHYQTGEPISAELLAKLKQAQNFMAGWAGLRQVMFGLNDLTWHGTDLDPLTRPEDTLAWEERALAPYRLLPAEGEAFSPAFSHIFSGGYSAGYYSYKWADALVADAYDAFRETWVFDPELARRLRTEILERGGSEDPAQLYLRFRGRAPDPDALLRSEGLGSIRSSAPGTKVGP